LWRQIEHCANRLAVRDFVTCADEPARLAVLESVSLWRVVDAAFPQIGEVARGGHEAAVVVEHNEAVVADQISDGLNAHAGP
jgi:hypothetical protein